MGLDKLRVGKLKRLEKFLILMAIAMALAVLTALRWRARHPEEDLQLTSHKRGTRCVSMFLLGLALLQGQARSMDLSRAPIPASEGI
jgi:hypothetical protein